MLKMSLDKLQQVAKPSDDVKHELTRFIVAMQVERNRREQKLILSKDELFELYNESFGAPQNIGGIAWQSTTRDHHTPELQQLMGRSYAVRDLLVDLQNGVCNIPKEVIERSGIETPDIFQNPDQVYSNPATHQWMQDEMNESKELKRNLLERNLDWKGAMLVRFFTTNL